MDLLSAVLRYDIEWIYTSETQIIIFFSRG